MMTTINRRRDRAPHRDGSAPVAAALVWTPAEAAAGGTSTPRRRARRAQRRPTRVQAEVLHRPRVRDGARARGPHHPARRAVRQRHRGGRAGVHGLHDDRPAAAADRDARRPGADRSAVDERFGKRFVDATDAQRTKSSTRSPTRRTPTGLSAAVAFFSSFRDLTASGFWSTKMGVADLQYRAIVRRGMERCPEPALKKLGVIRPDQ